jgi:hypothetical protein
MSFLSHEEFLMSQIAHGSDPALLEAALNNLGRSVIFYTRAVSPVMDAVILVSGSLTYAKTWIG